MHDVTTKVLGNNGEKLEIGETPLSRSKRYTEVNHEMNVEPGEHLGLIPYKLLIQAKIQLHSM